MALRPARRLVRTAAVVAASAALASTACTSSVPGIRSGPATGTLTAWTHGGTDAERSAMSQIVEEWNEVNPGARVDLVEVAEGDYGHAVQTAIVSGDLPDILEVDGPLVASYAYQGALLPLDGRLSPRTEGAMLASLREQGTVDGRLYAVGMFESGLALFADRSRLADAGIRIPGGVDDAWTAAEFRGILADLAAGDPDGRVLDLRRNYGVGEWLTYGFAPLVWSAGGDLLDPRTGRAHGALDSEPAVAALAELQAWQPYVDPNVDDAAFVERRVALSWVGHWAYADHARALGDDLLLVPLPDLGQGSRSSSGSWAWSVNARTSRPDDAVRFLDHVMSDGAVGTMTAANGAVPGTWSALDADARFDPDGDLALYAEALTRPCPRFPTDGCVATARPRTAAYPTITYAFATAVDAALRGADPADALAEAADTIDADVAANEGYGQAAPPE